MRKQDITRNTRVDIVNTMPWDIHFHSDVSRSDVCIPANGTYKLLTVDVVEHEILQGNIGFVGADGMGTHAPFKIVDGTLYKYLFNTTDTQKPYDFADIRHAIETIESKEEYQRVIDALVVTHSEAKATLYYMEEVNFEDMVAWKKNILLSRCKFLSIH